jgi:hypothetical protein
MTSHPTQRKPREEQPPTSHHHTGTTKTRPPHISGDRIENESVKANGGGPLQVWEGTWTCIPTSTRDAWHRIESQTELR